MIIELPKEKEFYVYTEETGTYNERMFYTVKARTEKEAEKIVKETRTSGNDKRIIDSAGVELDMDLQKISIVETLDKTEADKERTETLKEIKEAND